MREPDLQGIAGRAWKAPFTEDVKKRWPAGLDTWLMHVPGAHPLWAWYVVTACSLRDVEGWPPAKKRSPASTHEMSVIALNPDPATGFVPSDEWCTDTEHRWAKHILTPLNLCEQVEDFDDDKTNELVFLFVRAFCKGHANPDDDFRTANRTLFFGTVDHLRRGMHEAI